jgi:hypothetical protein
MALNWRLEYSNVDCKTHSEHCGCRVTVKGIGPQTNGLEFRAEVGSLSEQFREIAGMINCSLGYLGFDGKMLYKDSEVEYFKTNLMSDSTMTLVRPPIENKKPWPMSQLLCSVNPMVENALKRADARFFRHKFPYMHITQRQLQEEVWQLNDKGCRSLQSMCLRQLSSWHWACGHTNGKPHVVAAMSNLYPRKFAKAILSMARPRLNDRPREPMKFLNEAMDHLYRMLGVNLQQKTATKFSLKPLEGMYLGASNGVCEGGSYEILSEEEKIRVSNKGKKVDTFQQDLHDILLYLRTGKEPPIYWTVPPKCENFFSFSKQWSQEDWVAFEEKLRVFNIPSGIYILLERLVSLPRQLLERGMIRIGHKWSHGGADTTANYLGINVDNCFDPIIVEGDAKLYDQTVREMFVNLYFSTMAVHLDKSSPDYPIFEQIIKFLLRNMITRISQVFGELWAIIIGGVPSGAFNTSHMDSWIMALYFCLFCVWQIHNAPLEKQVELEAHLLLVVRIIVYGDDHLYKKGTGESAQYFSGILFAKFMKDYFDVTIRDLKEGVPFCSTERSGFLVTVGSTFLRHQFILNALRGINGQPNFLPYRESREFIIRAVHGRETKSRDVVDVMLSVVGHAYGTYASNRDAYDRLLLFYTELLSSIVEQLEDVPAMMLSRMTKDDLKKLRQTGVTAEQIVSGFPAWETLVEKNRYDPFYQDITRIEFDMDGDISGIGDIF